MSKARNQKLANGSVLDFEARLSTAADKISGHMDASEGESRKALIKADIANLSSN